MYNTQNVCIYKYALKQGIFKYMHALTVEQIAFENVEKPLCCHNTVIDPKFCKSVKH